MPTFSILAQIKSPTPKLLRRMVDSLVAQTNPDWELVLCVDRAHAKDRALVSSIVSTDPRIRVELRREPELLEWAVTALLPQLGDWVGTIGQHDRLDPTALAKIAAVLSPALQVVYTDEDMRDTWERVSFRHTKGAVNPLRLRHQEYLRALALVRRNWLSQLGGYQRLASDRPSHDLYLRTYEELGAAAFLHLPERLYWRHRDYLHTEADIRFQPHMVGYDLHAIRAHLGRSGLLASVEQVHGTVEIEYAPQRPLSVTIIATVTDDVSAGRSMLASLSQDPATYQPRALRVLYLGSNPTHARDFSLLAAGLGATFTEASGSHAAALNQEALAADSHLLLFLQGTPISTRWLHRMVDHIQLPGIGAVGARTSTPIRLTQPGITGWRYEGWDWNSRGRFNALAVPHLTAAVSPAALLVDRDRFVARRFDPGYPTLFGQDLCLRLGADIAWLPDAHVRVAELATSADEILLLKAAYSGWMDPYGLHQL